MVNGLLLTRRCETTGEELADPISIESAARLQLVSRFILTGLTHSPPSLVIRLFSAGDVLPGN
jgi:hypothetical protein